MVWIESALLGLLQGLTEFLPVSSSGHLALGSVLFGLEADQAPLLVVFLHLGTALSIATVYWRDLLDLVASLRHVLRPTGWARAWRDDPAFRTAMLVALSAIPTGIAGLAFKDDLEALLDDALVVGLCLVTTGVVLWLTRRVRAEGGPIGPGRAIVMGVAQSVALLPGISRSGATISCGLFSGGSRHEVGRFAFLMLLPPILGAVLLKSRDLATDGAMALGPVLLGTAIAFGSGVLALRILLRFVSRGRLHLFAPYCVLLGILAMIA